MPQTRDWKSMRDMMTRLLLEKTGQNVEEWNGRIDKENFIGKEQLRNWLARHGVTGYAQSLLVMEKFGYPDFMLASADALIDGQYADRLQLRPILDEIIRAASTLGELTIQARKTYVSLVTPKRTFARVQPTTKNRVDLGLRLENEKPGGRLMRSNLNETMQIQIGLQSIQEIDSEVLGWLQQAYQENS
jgi:hypothetical protein